MRLGVEAEDIIAAARNIARWPDVDASRIGVYGKSYGGFITASILAAGPGPFRAAISAAPVTDWRLYDTHFSEKYMKTKAENAEGYANSSVITKAANIGTSGASFLLVHGTFDENVHFQHAADLALALIASGVAFDNVYYPNVAHNLETAGGGARNHYYRFLSRWINANV
jgi:dipeptidyl-peptidase 4